MGRDTFERLYMQDFAEVESRVFAGIMDKVTTASRAPQRPVKQLAPSDLEWDDLLLEVNPKPKPLAPQALDPKKEMWRSSSGMMRIGDMEDDHLENTIAWLRRDAEQKARENGKPAGHWRNFVRPIYHSMMAVAKERNL